LIKNKKEMKAIRANSVSGDINALDMHIEEIQQPVAGKDECVVKVLYSGVNPSDVGAVLGKFPKAIWPRYTGRDFAGVIVGGPAELLGKEVWGTGGELGIRTNGSHAAYLVIPTLAVSEKPVTITLPEAAGIGVPFITAYEGLRRAGLPKRGQWVLIFGVNGKVGQAATQIATRLGAKVIGVDHRSNHYRGYTNSSVVVINSSESKVPEAVMEITGGHGADIVYNTVGSPCFEDANHAMAHSGTQIFIADRLQKEVSFNIFYFYRHQHNFVGIDTQELDVVDCAGILNELKPGFLDGTLVPFAVKAEQIYPLERAHEAYRQTYAGSMDKIILKIND
jgi:NADPH2:quinone reductase